MHTYNNTSRIHMKKCTRRSRAEKGHTYRCLIHMFNQMYVCTRGMNFQTLAHASFITNTHNTHTRAYGPCLHVYIYIYIYIYIYYNTFAHDARAEVMHGTRLSQKHTTYTHRLHKLSIHTCTYITQIAQTEHMTDQPVVIQGARHGPTVAGASQETCEAAPQRYAPPSASASRNNVGHQQLQLHQHPLQHQTSSITTQLLQLQQQALAAASQRTLEQQQTLAQHRTQIQAEQQAAATSSRPTFEEQEESLGTCPFATRNTKPS
jgi:hypothetical protein